MGLWYPLGAYGVGWLATARILWRVLPARIREEDGPFGPVVLSLLWPLLAAGAAVVGVSWCLGWLVMLPLKRREAAAERAELVQVLAGGHGRR